MKCATITLMAILVLIVLGLAFGSFVNAAVWRFHEHEELRGGRRKKGRGTKTQNLSIVNGRSMCTHCGHQLAARDLVPVVSYVLLRGKCRYCDKPIEDTPLSEVVLPLAFVGSYVWWPYGFQNWHGPGSTLFVFWLISLVGFMFLALYDLRWFLLPDKIVFPLIGIAALEVFMQAVVFGGGWVIILDALWGIVFLAGIFYILYLVSKGSWIGFGDVKLGIALGLFVGGPLNALMVLFLASLIGSLAAVPMLLNGTAHAKTKLPFGPLLLLATVVIMIFGNATTQWYTSLLGLR